jgi:hypothetical protein
MWLLPILALALSLRLTALDWGLPTPSRDFTFHPDEWAGVTTVLHLMNEPGRPSATPYARSKGTGYFYTAMAGVMAARSSGLIQFDGMDYPRDLVSHRRMYLVPRIITMMFSVGVVVLTYLCGRRLLGEGPTLLASLLVAVSPVSVINAHYVKTDCSLAFFMTLTLYFASRSRTDWRWLPAGTFIAGSAAAFKYPGASSLLLVVAAALFFDPGSRRKRLVAAVFSLPLFALGFLVFCPEFAVSPEQFLSGLKSEFGSKIISGQGMASPLIRMAAYPWFLSRGSGAVVVIWSIAALVYCALRRLPETNVLIAWAIPFAALMASSSLVAIRYAVPLMPVFAILMARTVIEPAARGSRTRRRLLLAAAGLGAAHLLFITCLHLRAMSRPDPRDQASDWINNHVPPGAKVAITPSHLGDRTFVVPVDDQRYKVTQLDMSCHRDVSGHLQRPFTYLATNIKAWVEKPGQSHPSHRAFWKEIMDSDRWEPAAVFDNRPKWTLVFMRGELPEDMYYIYQETRIYKTRRISVKTVEESDVSGD